MEADHFVPGFELRVEEAHGGGEALRPSSSVPHHDENVAILHDDDDDDSLTRELQWQKGPVSLPLREIEGFPEPSVFSAMPEGVHLFMEEDEIAKWLHHQFSPAEANGGRAADFGTELPGSSSIDSDAAVSLWMTEDAGDELGIGLTRTLEVREQKAVASEGAKCQSKNEEFQCGEKRIDGHQPASRRTRAANVHNLSERRRRDRINEKIKALRDLMPSCYKSDQASILDDAIEYLKSLQLQVQMLSIQYNTRQMMFSNTQIYLPAMGLMGMGIGMTAWAEISAGAMQHPFMPLAYPPIPPIVGTSPAHLKLPLMPSLHSANFAIAHQLRAQASNQQDPALTSVNMLRPNMMQISDFADPYQYYAGLTPLQVPSQILARTEPGNSKEIEQ